MGGCKEASQRGSSRCADGDWSDGRAANLVLMCVEDGLHMHARAYTPPRSRACMRIPFPLGKSAVQPCRPSLALPSLNTHVCSHK